MSSEGITALVLGASGAVGKEVVKKLINSPRVNSIKLVSRRNLDFQSNKIEENLVDFDNLNNHKDVFQNVQVAYCCLGTIRATGGAEGYVKVDRDYVYESAKLLKENNCPHFNLVTSVKADAKSKFIYLKTKGEIEQMVTELDFYRFSIFRPALLMCDRDHIRLFEKTMQIVAKGFDWGSRMSISVETVAHAMVTNTFLENASKVEIYENLDMIHFGID